MSLPASLPDSPKPGEVPVEKNGPGFQSLLDRLSILEEPVSREGAGRLIAQSPGERYSLQFRLLARGPEALRLEIFDPFGRPTLHLISFSGRIRVYSLAQKKEIPFNQSLFGHWASFIRFPAQEIFKLFWGRVPLIPFQSFRIGDGSDEGKDAIKLILEGAVEEELWITPRPFSLHKARISGSVKTGEIEVAFSDYSQVAGNRIPLRCEIREGQGETSLTIRYETLVLRPDLPDEIFDIPDFAGTPSPGKQGPE
jgi:hypothetical protein